LPTAQQSRRLPVRVVQINQAVIRQLLPFLLFPRCHVRPELSGGLAENPFECAIELREGLKAYFVCNFADAQIWVQQAVARVFETDARDVIGEL